MREKITDRLLVALFGFCGIDFFFVRSYNVFMRITVYPDPQENNYLPALLKKEGVMMAMPCGGNGHCGKCRVLVDGKPALACQTYIEKRAEVEIPETGRIRSESGLVETKLAERKILDLAVDVGTTTVTVALIDGSELIETITFDNPQLFYGADVLTRIRSAKKAGVSVLQKVLTDAIEKAKVTLQKKYDCELKRMIVCGNTVMLHIFWGEDPSSLGVAPYTPRFLEKREGTIPVFGKIKVITLPCLSSYVGADIVAGIAACDCPKEGKVDLLIDLGTNAEIALIGEKEIITTSTSAGPCFEGGNISCGMPATDGAIKSFSLEEGKKKISYFGTRPQGVCGTGLIDIIGQLVKNNIIDETGYLKEENGYLISNNVILLQEDVRAFQTAKSAVRSGVEILMEEAKKSYHDVDRVYLAGGFSAEINVENVVLSGLLAKEFSSKCIAARNTALSGTIGFAVSEKRVEEIKRISRYIDLGGLPRFSELFIKNINFS